jgi:hypothetical protein
MDYIKPIKVTKKYKGNYLIHIDKIYVGSIDRLENGEWVCYDEHDRPFEICNTKRYAITKFQ